MFFVRITFRLKKTESFENLSAERIELFTFNGAKCTAMIDNRANRNLVVLECGGFPTKEMADIIGTNLIRCIKLQMITKEVPIHISGKPGVLDDTGSSHVSGVITEVGKQLLRHGAFFGIEIPGNIRIENDYIGLGVFEVKNDLREIRFFSQEAELHIKRPFELEYKEFHNWDHKLDICLSLLNASTSINDVRIKFLLRLMAIEALVSESQLREDEYLIAIDALKAKIDELAIKDEYKQRLKGQLSLFREKSISQKVNELIELQLDSKLYNGLPAKKFFAQCYKARSSFVHSGSLGETDIFKLSQFLKQMALDMITSISCPNVPKD